MSTKPISSTTLIKEAVKDQKISPQELADIRSSLANNPEADAIREWVKDTYPGLLALIRSDYDVSIWNKGKGATIKNGKLYNNVTQDIVDKLGLKAETSRGTMKWSFKIDYEKRFKHAMKKLEEKYEGTLNWEYRKPSFTTWADATVHWEGGPELKAALDALDYMLWRE